MRQPLLPLLAALAALAGCNGDDEQQGSPPPERTATDRTATERGPARARGGPRLETVATGLDTPWEIAFLPDGRALVSERPGRIRLLSPDLKLRPEPVAELEVEELGEGGLLGLAIDPGFEGNSFVYAYRTTSAGNEVVRLRMEGERLVEETVVVDGIEAAAIHDGGRLRFGPDRRLYFAPGEAGQPALAQDRGSLNGKVLSLGLRQARGEGGRPRVFTLGHRNSQGFDWEPRSGRMLATDHGPDGDDELNVLRRGRNYGWPEVRGPEHGDFEAPIAVYEQSIAPSGGSFVTRGGSEWSGDFLFGALVGEQIRRITLDGDRVTRNEALFEGRLGRVRTVVEGPDGALYALTSNRDGRGSPREGDDRVVRIVPPAAG